MPLEVLGLIVRFPQRCTQPLNLFLRFAGPLHRNAHEGALRAISVGGESQRPKDSQRQHYFVGHVVPSVEMAPNPSIERTATGVPASASHVKR